MPVDDERSSSRSGTPSLVALVEYRRLVNHLTSTRFAATRASCSTLFRAETSLLSMVRLTRSSNENNVSILNPAIKASPNGIEDMGTIAVGALPAGVGIQKKQEHADYSLVLTYPAAASEHEFSQ
jgi:hypothetical protein